MSAVVFFCGAWSALAQDAAHKTGQKLSVMPGASSWWTLDHAALVLGISCFTFLIAMTWVWLLRRRVWQQTLLIRRQLRRELALAELGHKLAKAETAEGAARIIFDIAQDLLGWDACLLDLYSNERDQITPILSSDTIDGQRVDVCGDSPGSKPSPTERMVMEQGAKLILRAASDKVELWEFGDKARKSASLMFVPLRERTKVMGILSIQSYTPDFYDEQKLSILQALADHCGGALERIRAQDDLQNAHDELESRVEKRTSELSQTNTHLQQEIAERKRTEGALAHGKHLLDMLLDNAPDFIYFKDARSRFTRVNQAFLEQINLNETQVIGKTDFDLFNPELARQAFADEQQVLLGEALPNKEEHAIGRDGREWWVITSKMPLRNEAGKIIGTFGISRNITARKQAEMALQKQGEEHRIIFDSVPALINFKDTQNRNLRVNKFAADLIGLPVEKIEGNTLFDLSPKFGEKYYQDDLEVIRSGQPKLGIIEQFMRANGELRWLQTDKIPYRDTTGKVIGVIVFAIDITERKRAEEELQAAYAELEKRVEERTAKLSKAVSLLKQEMAERRQAEIRNEAFSHLGQQLSLATSPEAAAQIVLDVAEKLLGLDSGYLHLFTPESSVRNGAAEDERKVIPVVIFDTIDGKRTTVRDNSKTAGLSERDKKIIAHGAELVLGESVAPDLSRFGDANQPSLARMFVPIRNGAQVVGAMSIQSYTAKAYDAEDLKILQALSDFCAGTLEKIQAEQLLRQSEERFSKAFRSSPVPMTLSTMHDGFYVDVNDSILLMLGYQREEIIGRTSIELGIWAYSEARAKMIQQLKEKKSVRDFECQFRPKSGVLRDVLLSVERLDFAGVPHILAIFHDVTDRLNLEAQLRQSQKMEAVGQLAAGVAHDFNNILTIIQGHAGLLLATDGIDDSSAESLNQVFLAAERAATLTRQLLTFSRKQIMQPRLLDVNEVVGSAAKMMRRLLGEHIGLHFNYASYLPPIHADTGMLEQIIINLAVNARDAMGHNGQLVISTSAVDIDEHYVRKNRESRPGHFVCLTVADNGCGMDAETLARIFEPFFTTKEVGKGTGLGLATVYGIVKQHQGWLEVASEIGRGTVFKVFLPSNTKPVAPIESAPAPRILGGTETILVVEDELALRELVCSLLQHYGYEVVAAAHGKEALEIWDDRSQEIDLVLTDMMMPEGVSGWELAEAIQQKDPGIKIIYTSGYSVDLFGQNRSLREGVNFLAKPYHPRTLAKAIRDCLDS